MACAAATSVDSKLRSAGRPSGRHETTERKGKTMSKLTLKTEGDRHIVVTRRFAAAPEAVYRAHTDPALVRKWMLGPDGWSMPVCICEARPHVKTRYEWWNSQGGGSH